MTRKSILLILMPLVCCLPSCKCGQHALPSEPVTLHSSDSVRTEYIERVRVDTVTVTVPIPAETAMQTVRDSVSWLETGLAESRAWINTDGSLGHWLKNKAGTLEAETLVPVKETQEKETEIKFREVPVKVPYAVEVEKELTAWQRFRIDAFWWLLGAALAGALWAFRGPIMKILRFPR